MLAQYAPVLIVVILVVVFAAALSILRRPSRKTRYEELSQSNTYVFGFIPQLVLGLGFFVVVLGMLFLADHMMGGTVSRAIMG